MSRVDRYKPPQYERLLPVSKAHCYQIISFGTITKSVIHGENNKGHKPEAATVGQPLTTV